MERHQQEPQPSDDTGTQPVNYLPGMPAVSAEPGRIERFVASLLQRRGSLRPVVRDRRRNSSE